MLLVKNNIISQFQNNTNNVENQFSREEVKQGQTIMVYVEEVIKNATGTPIVISRINPKFVTRLMEKDINEISDGKRYKSNDIKIFASLVPYIDSKSS